MKGRMIVVCFVIIVLVSAGCSSGGDGSSAPPALSKVTVSGTINAPFDLVSNKTLFDRIFAGLSPAKNAYAMIAAIDSILAISPDGMIVEASKSGQSFSLALPRDKSYVIVMLYHTNIAGIYKVNSTADLDSLPIGPNTPDFGLGLVSLAGGTATGDVDVLPYLGLSTDMAAAIGNMDNGFTRYANVDADGDGTKDHLFGKQYRLFIGYQINGGQTYADIVSRWSTTASMHYDGYTFSASFKPGEHLSSNPTLSFELAKLHAPQNINLTNDLPVIGSFTFFDSEDIRVATFPTGTTPATPPAGMYTVAVPLMTGGTQTFTIRNVRSQLIDANLKNVYVPLVRVTTDGGGHVTLIEWQWWKWLNGTDWVQPTSTELAAVMDSSDNVNFNLMSRGCEIVARAPYTSTGSIVPPSDTCVPVIMEVSFFDKAGDGFRFYWH
jgi:hypothetical protein